MVISDTVHCPQCKYTDAFYELDTRRRSEWLLCPKCGYEVRCITITNSKTGMLKEKNNGEYIVRKYDTKPARS